MSCYHPWLGVPGDVNEDGVRQYKLTCGWNPVLAKLNPGSIRIPCGKCIGCRLDYSRSWADRMMLELCHTGKAVFLTLTYDNDHVPCTENEDGEFGWFTLYKRDLQLFFKKLRKRKQFKDREIRYYAAGEYGSTTHRPHYHAIVFGIGLEDFPDLKRFKKNELGDTVWISALLYDIWENGFCTIGEVSWKSCAYVSRYVQKKVFSGNMAFLEMIGAEQEFSLMSRRPGIGAYYLEDNPDLFDNSNIWIKGHKEAISIPKYFLKKLKLIDPDRYDMIIQQRKDLAQDSLLLKMQKTELSYIEQLEVEENQKLAVTKVLKRL